MSKEVSDNISVYSFLYLHPNENSAVALVSPVLDINNYHSWSRSMITALIAKNKLEFVDGSAPEPAKGEDTYQTWRRCNNMVVSWIVHSVSPSIRQSILWMSKAEDIWKDLKSRYFQGNLIRVSDLQMEAFSIKQGDLTVTDYFTKLRVIWDEIENFRPDPGCSCKAECPCEAISVILQRKVEDLVMQFLRGLNKQYNNVKSHVLYMDPMPSINKVFSYVAQQERQIMGSNMLNESEVKINTANNQLSCTFCGKNGHLEANCYRKNGFLQNNDAKGFKNSSKKVCVHCGRTGHTIDVCYRKHEFPPGYKFSNSRANAVKTVDAQQENGQDSTGQEQDFRLTQQQYQALMSLLQENKEDTPIDSNTSKVNTVCKDLSQRGNSFISSFSCKRDIWILDSGATDHVSCSLKHFASYNKIEPIIVSLPNNTHVTATHRGYIKLKDKLFLKDVLFIPSFVYNLVSISKLVSTLNVEIVFTSKSCVIQEQISKEKIGIAKSNHGLYVIDNHAALHTTSHKCNSVDVNLWHDRLDHMSDERLAILKQKHLYINFDKTGRCDSCHFAKQKKLPFPKSTSYVANCFDILHVDIWGPYSIPSLHSHRYFLTIVDGHSRFTWVYLMCNKSETRKHLEHFVHLIKNQFEKSIKIIRSDNGPKFK